MDGDAFVAAERLRSGGRRCRAVCRTERWRGWSEDHFRCAAAATAAGMVRLFAVVLLVRHRCFPHVRFVLHLLRSRSSIVANLGVHPQILWTHQTHALDLNFNLKCAVGSEPTTFGKLSQPAEQSTTPR